MNNDFAARLPLTGQELQFDWSNVGGTAEAGEPHHGFGPARSSVWWTWRPSATGRAYLKVTGSGFSVAASVYVGNSLTTLQRIVATGDQNKAGSLFFDAVEGADYDIVVDSLSATTGVFNFALTSAADARPRVALESGATGGFFLNVGEGSGQATIFASEDLFSWAPIQTNNVQAGQKIFLPAGTERQRFYQLQFE